MSDITLLDGAIAAIRANNLTDAITHITTFKEQHSMKVLSITPQPAPAAAPHLDMTDVVATTATIVPKKGHEFWVCNPMDELVEAMEAGERFVGHRIVGMKAKRVVFDPSDIARVEEA